MSVRNWELGAHLACCSSNQLKPTYLIPIKLVFSPSSCLEFKNKERKNIPDCNFFFVGQLNLAWKVSVWESANASLKPDWHYMVCCWSPLPHLYVGAPSSCYCCCSAAWCITTYYLRSSFVGEERKRQSIIVEDSLDLVTATAEVVKNVCGAAALWSVINVCCISYIYLGWWITWYLLTTG